MSEDQNVSVCLFFFQRCLKKPNTDMVVLLLHTVYMDPITWFYVTAVQTLFKCKKYLSKNTEKESDQERLELILVELCFQGCW